MAFADTKEKQLQLFPLVRKFFDKLNNSEDKEQVIWYDFYMNNQVLKELCNPLSFYVQRLLNALLSYHGFNRGALAIRDDSGFFIIKHTSYKDKKSNQSIEDVYGTEDLYKFNVTVFANDETFFIDDSLDVKRYNYVFPVRNINGTLIALLLLDNTYPTKRERKFLTAKILEPLGEFVSDYMEIKLRFDATNVDHLTGAYNRNFILKAEKDYYKNISFIAFLDLDYFKQLNDKFGHAIGDIALRLTVKVIKEHIREADIARWGGEEFVIIFNKSNSLSALKKRLEEINTILSNTPIPGIKYGDRQVTFSAGILRYNNQKSFQENLNEADKKLYRAKEEGRFRVV